MTDVVVLSRDLMDGERFRAALPGVVIGRRPEAPEVAQARLIVLDLAGGFDVVEIVAIGPPVIAYGAHVDTEALAAAVEIGCIEAVPRSRIFRRVADWEDEP